MQNTVTIPLYWVFSARSRKWAKTVPSLLRYKHYWNYHNFPQRVCCFPTVGNTIGWTLTGVTAISELLGVNENVNAINLNILMTHFISHSCKNVKWKHQDMREHNGHFWTDFHTQTINWCFKQQMIHCKVIFIYKHIVFTEKDYISQ